MEDTNIDIPPFVRASDKRIIRQASNSFAFIALLAVISLGTYIFGTQGRNLRVLGTETVIAPSPFPTLPPIPTLIPTTPTPTPKILRVIYK
jgi:hypothetical protein